jgi:hypothetical protein
MTRLRIEREGKMRHFILGSLLLGASAAGPAAAQDQAEKTEPAEIIVQGSKDRDRQVRDFIGALTDVPRHGQISRFDWLVCPAAVGLGQAQNEAIAKRMRRIASAAKVPLAPAGCAPNVLVIVSADKKAVIEELSKKYPAYFHEMSAGDVRKLANSPGPAAAWHVKGLVTKDGALIAKVDRRYVNEGTDTPSRLAPSTRPLFVAAVVVVELDALAGLSTTQLADYAALRAFTEADPARLADSRASTILTILDKPVGSEVPLSLTQWDLSFLTSLYASSNDAYANRQRAEMKGIFKDELKKTQESNE